MTQDQIGFLIYSRTDDEYEYSREQNISVVRTQKMAEEIVEQLELKQHEEIKKYNQWLQEREDAFEQLSPDATEKEHDELYEYFDLKNNFDYNGYDEQVFGYYEIRLIGFEPKEIKK